MVIASPAANELRACVCAGAELRQCVTKPASPANIRSCGARPCLACRRAHGKAPAPWLWVSLTMSPLLLIGPTLHNSAQDCAASTAACCHGTTAIPIASSPCTIVMCIQNTSVLQEHIAMLHLIYRAGQQSLSASSYCWIRWCQTVRACCC